jgi:hypothetical protein
VKQPCLKSGNAFAEQRYTDANTSRCGRHRAAMSRLHKCAHGVPAIHSSTLNLQHNVENHSIADPMTYQIDITTFHQMNNEAEKWNGAATNPGVKAPPSG